MTIALAAPHREAIAAGERAIAAGGTPSTPRSPPP